MNQHHKHERQAAATAFTESLEQLEQQLMETGERAIAPPQPPSSPSQIDGRSVGMHAPARSIPATQSATPSHQQSPSNKNSLQVFADAAADIERFIQTRR